MAPAPCRHGADREAVERVRRILHRAPDRIAMLQTVAALGLPDAWLAAGAIRNAVWDALHGIERATPLADADVIWFEPSCLDSGTDRRLEQALASLLPGITWSVKNQARMHRRHGDAQYADCLDAMRAWPETATAVAARLRNGTLELQAPYGFDDLLSLRLRPTGRCAPQVFTERVSRKGWLQLWPRLTVVSEA